MTAIGDQQSVQTMLTQTVLRVYITKIAEILVSVINWKHLPLVNYLLLHQAIGRVGALRISVKAFYSHTFPHHGEGSSDSQPISES